MASPGPDATKTACVARWWIAKTEVFESCQARPLGSPIPSTALA
jgi:hypothetical protein